MDGQRPRPRDAGRGRAHRARRLRRRALRGRRAGQRASSGAARSSASRPRGPTGRWPSSPCPTCSAWTRCSSSCCRSPAAGCRRSSVAWDARERRWFSLYPGERIDADDPLHWTKPALNWNFSCAECHATDLERRFDVARTSTARAGTACTSAARPATGRPERTSTGPGRRPRRGQSVGFEAPISRSSTAEVEACARCHARRAPLADGFDHRHRLMDDYLPALLTEGLYHADGQILDEVYEYGSFLQSKMFAHGVRCSDCHEPHALGLSSAGNLACTRCHSPTPNLPAHVDARELKRQAYDSPSAPLPHARRAGLGVRRLPHADAHVHARRSAPRSLAARAAPGSRCTPRHARRVHRLPHGSRRRVGGGGDRAALRAVEEAAALRRCAPRRPHGAARRGRCAARARGVQGPADRARQRARAARTLSEPRGRRGVRCRRSPIPIRSCGSRRWARSR
jgi:hypothetical protein